MVIIKYKVLGVAIYKTNKNAQFEFNTIFNNSD